MAYVPPSSSGISFVFGGASYTPPNAGALSFVFSQGGIDAAYVAGIVPVSFAVAAEGGAPVRGEVAGSAEFSVSATGGAPVNGAVVASPTFSAVATFAPAGAVSLTAPISVFAYKVPDVTGASAVKVPFLVTAARSAGAFIVAPLTAEVVGNHGLQAELHKPLRLSCVATAKVGRAAVAAFCAPFAVTAGASLPITAAGAARVPLTAAAGGRTTVRGVGSITAPVGVYAAAAVRHDGAAAFTAPLIISASATVRQEGFAAFTAPISVSADNADARVGSVRSAVRFAVAATGRAGTTGTAQVRPAFSVVSAGANARVGSVAVKVSVRALGSGGHGISGQTSAWIFPLVSAEGRHTPLTTGAGATILPFRVRASGGRTLARHVGGSYVTTHTERMAVFR